MSLMPIIEIPDPILRQQSLPVETIDDDLRRLVKDMLETMYAAPGIGLAGVQVAVPRRLLVIDLQEPVLSEVEGPEEGTEGEDGQEGPPVRRPMAFINPEILESSADRKSYNEGCLSIPDQYAEIERPARVRTRWLDEHGKRQEQEFDGLMAVCIQHEVDHLNGILFIDHLSRLKRDMLVKKVIKARREREGAAVL